jgi:ABC-type branched-subunit amino acid transport system permease subunit/ABC-type branched-subunit amino acid transport system ATPase component
MVIAAFELGREFIFRGVVEGMIYALVAMGLVLVYRATGIVNFAQGQIGAFGALLMASLAVNYDIPYALTFPLAIVSGAALGAAIELLVVRRLFDQPRLLLFVATLGVSQVILLLMFRLPEITQAVSFPTAIDHRWTVAGVNVRGDQLMVLVTVPVFAAALALLLTRTAFGQAVRASADNPSAASLAGISTRAVSTQVWVIAGVLSVVSAVLIGPIQGANAGSVQESLGPSLLLRALAAAMVGGMTSFPLAVVGGIGIGVVEVLIRVNDTSASGLDSLFVFLLLVALVLLRGRRGSDAEGSWSLTGRVRAASREIAELPIARWTSRAVVGVMFAAAAALPFLVTSATDRNRYAVVLIYAIVALSATVLTGWAGQLSLGQFAFVGVGAYATAYYARELPYPVALAVGTTWGVLLAIVVGVPALRVRGLYLAMLTLGFQLTCNAWLFPQDRLNNGSSGSTARLEHRYFYEWNLVTQKRAYYYVCLGALVLALLAVTQLRRSGLGRSIIAVRDNEPSAAAFTISPTRAKLVAFSISGGLAAMAGGLYAASPSQISAPYFAPEESLRIVAISIVGGVTSVAGAVLGTLVVEGLPAIFSGSAQVKLFASGVGMLVLLMYFPGGLVSILHTLRDHVYAAVARRFGLVSRPSAPHPTVSALSSSPARTAAAADPRVESLRVVDVSVAFGGRRAVDAVSLHVSPGEVVGLIGTNGAGKTTLMNAISGFAPASGAVEVFGRRVDDLPPHRRARQGMGRAFQNARLFGALTVRETLMTALEARSRSLIVPSLLALPPSPTQEARKRREADEIIDYLGLGRYADRSLAELSTGTRRIVELGSLIALDSRLLLLDEPTAGVAQKETEAFGPLIAEIRRELGAAVLLIEHDMPLVMSISDRIYCLEAGTVIAEGAPVEVRNDPAVIASYLGTDERAIQRSGARTG